MIRTNQTDLIVGFQTHPGETGKNNEDRALLRSYRGGPSERGDVTLAVVADGIGGHQAGEVASQIAIDTLTSLFDRTDSKAYLDLFARGFATISQSIAQHVAERPQSEGMGTTCAAAVIANRRLYTGYIGDSRIYLIRGGALRQLTVDHTWVQEAIEHGVLTKEQARKHPNRHVVRRHLGAQPDSTPDYRMRLSDHESPEAAVRNQGLPLKPSDVVLLSSDGMTDLVEDHEILAAFQNQTPQAAVDALTLLARQRGGFDNITMIALQVPAPRSGRTGLAGTALLVAGLGTFGGLALIAALALGGYFYFFNPLHTATPTPPSTGESETRPYTPTAPPLVILTATLAPTTQPPATPTPLPPTATFTPRPTVSSTPTLDPTAAALTASAAPSLAPLQTGKP